MNCTNLYETRLFIEYLLAARVIPLSDHSRQRVFMKQETGFGSCER